MLRHDHGAVPRACISYSSGDKIIRSKHFQINPSISVICFDF